MADKTERKDIETTEEQAVSAGTTEKDTKIRKKGKKRKIVKRLIWTLVILLLVGVAVWSVYSKLQSDYRITYDPYTATTGSISNSLSFTGSMQLVNSSSFTAESDAKVREVYVAEGDKVSKGDKLIRLSTGDTLEAEFDGTVSTVDVAKGDEVKNGDSLLTVADFDHMKVSVRVGESNISEVTKGIACRVTVSSANATYDATIDKIDHVAYSGNNVAYYTATVYVDTSETENIWPGMQATVTIPLEEAQNVTVLKMDALSTARDNTAFVYKENENGEMEEVTVTVGVSNGNYVEIKDGVTSGETVYKVAEKEEEVTGIAALFSGLFTNRQVNRPSRSGSGNGSMPDFSNMDMSNMPNFGSGSGSGSGDFPGGGSGNFPGGGSRGN